MANRTIQQKILKKKRRNRFARFSGASAKYAVRVGPTPFTEDAEGNTKTLATKMILVGKISLSNQTINTGRGPNQERMVQYYHTVESMKYAEVIPDAVPLTEPVKEMAKRYYTLVRETPKENRITVFQDRLGRIDLFYQGEQCFFVELDFVTGECRRSRVYDKRSTAFDRYNNNRIAWVETLTP